MIFDKLTHNIVKFFPVLCTHETLVNIWHMCGFEKNSLQKMKKNAFSIWNLTKKVLYCKRFAI